MEQDRALQKEAGTEEKILGALHHVGRGMSDEDVGIATLVLATVATVAGFGAALAGFGAALAGFGATVSVAGTVAIAGTLISISAGITLEKTTEKHADAIAPEAAKKANMAGKGLLVCFMLAAALTAGSWAHNAVTQDLSGKPAEPPAATATHDYRISGGADCLLQKEFTPSAEGRQAGNDNNIVLYSLPKKCQVQEITAPGR